MRKFLIIKNIVVWAVFSVFGLIALTQYARLFVADLLDNDGNTFWPGALLLGAGIILALVFCVTRVIKNIKILRTIDAE